MLKEIFSAFRTHGFALDTETRIREMFRLAEKNFHASTSALLEQKEVTYDLYAKDREINLLVVEVRKRILQHFSVTTCQNIGGALVFLKVINDIERTGDYSKNLLDLTKLLSGPLQDSIYTQRLSALCLQVGSFFPLAQKALFDGKEDDANQVLHGHHRVNQECEKILEELMKAENHIAAQQAIALALTARYFKRVSSHLKNVASAAINPFPHIGYMHIDKEDPS